MGPSLDEMTGNAISNHIYALIHNRMHRAPKDTLGYRLYMVWEGILSPFNVDVPIYVYRKGKPMATFLLTKLC